MTLDPVLVPLAASAAGALAATMRGARTYRRFVIVVGLASGAAAALGGYTCQLLSFLIASATATRVPRRARTFAFAAVVAGLGWLPFLIGARADWLVSALGLAVAAPLGLSGRRDNGSVPDAAS